MATKQYAKKVWARLVKYLGPAPEEHSRFKKEMSARRECAQEWRRMLSVLGTPPIDAFKLEREVIANIRRPLEGILCSETFPMMGGLPRGGAFPKLLIRSNQKLGGQEAVTQLVGSIRAVVDLCLGGGTSCERLDRFNSNQAILWAYENGHNYGGRDMVRAASCVIPTGLLSMMEPQQEFIVRIEDSLRAAIDSGECEDMKSKRGEVLSGRQYEEITQWGKKLLSEWPVSSDIGLLGIYCLLLLDANER